MTLWVCKVVEQQPRLLCCWLNPSPSAPAPHIRLLLRSRCLSIQESLKLPSWGRQTELRRGTDDPMASSPHPILAEPCPSPHRQPSSLNSHHHLLSNTPLTPGPAISPTMHSTNDPTESSSSTPLPLPQTPSWRIYTQHSWAPSTTPKSPYLAPTCTLQIPSTSTQLRGP